MIPIEKLTSVRKIISHTDADGIASAMILRDALGDIPVELHQYNTKELRNLEAEPGLLFCDITPPYQGAVDRTSEFVAAGAIVLDHHATARNRVDQFGELGVFGDETLEPGLSGALLAFWHVWYPLRFPFNHLISGRIRDQNELPRRTVERFAVLVGIRDTWQASSPLWEEACVLSSALMFPPEKEFLQIQDLPKFLLEEMGKYIWAGKIKYDSSWRTCQRAIDDGFRFTSAKGTRVVIFQGTKFVSDAAELAGDQFDLVGAYDMFCEENISKAIFSIRSHTNFDCAALAKFKGGGGHQKAAGFAVTQPIETPFRVFESLLAEYEA